MRGKIANLHPKLKAKLVVLEDLMGFELTINSGFRTPAHNKQVGGVEGSEHTYNPAEAVDVKVLRSVTRYKMVQCAMGLGFKRVGMGKTFVHLGIAADKPQRVLWLYG